MGTFQMKKISFLLCLLPLTFGGGCSGKAPSAGAINPNFPDLGSGAITPSASVNPNNQDQVVVVEPGSSSQNGVLGQIADQETTHAFCVLIDPAADGNADLEVCDASRVNTETPSVNGICPEADAVSRCASSNTGGGPDFCQVTGARDYVFVIMNPTSQPVSVAYEVVDVTGYPHQSCADLGITENTLQADDF